MLLQHIHLYCVLYVASFFHQYKTWWLITAIHFRAKPQSLVYLRWLNNEICALHTRYYNHRKPQSLPGLSSSFYFFLKLMSYLAVFLYIYLSSPISVSFKIALNSYIYIFITSLTFHFSPFFSPTSLKFYSYYKRS